MKFFEKVPMAISGIALAIASLCFRINLSSTETDTRKRIMADNVYEDYWRISTKRQSIKDIF